MGKITVYIKLIDGKLDFRDTEKHQGKTIESIANPGDKIAWCLDKDAGIIDLTGINIVGTLDFLSKGPLKKAKDKWTARISKKATGEIAYTIFYTPGTDLAKKTKTKAKSAVNFKTTDEEPPIIKIKG